MGIYSTMADNPEPDKAEGLVEAAEVMALTTTGEL